MTMYKSDWVTGVKPMPTPNGDSMVNVMLALPVSATQVVGDIYEMGFLPYGCVLVDAVFAATDVDTGATPAHAMSFGVVKPDGSDLATILQAGITVGQAGTATGLTKTVATLTTSSAMNAQSILGFKLNTASATPASGTVYLNVTYRNAQYGY